MKKKFLVFTLCFTLIFSSLNYKDSYADGGIISLPMVAVVSSLAVGTGIVLSGNDDLYDIGYLFYDYVKKHNDLTWESVKLAFNSSVALLPNNLVSVKSDFLDIVKDFFDSTFNNNLGSSMGYQYAIPFFPGLDVDDVYYESNYLSSNALSANITGLEGDSFTVGLLDFEYSYLYSTGKPAYNIFYNGLNVGTVIFKKGAGNHLFISTDDSKGKFKLLYAPKGENFHLNSSAIISASNSISIPYNGGYTWDNVDSKTDDDKSVALPIPGDLGHLVGKGESDFWDNTNDLVGNGDISIPSTDNPSIDIGGDTSFPGSISPDIPDVDSPSVPNEGIWATIKDFIISLVVPNDTFWTDTWGGLYNNFTNSFPMVDMDGFNDLVTGEKKFPNIDIDIMGVTGRVVNGDVVNSIVDWLRPIIAGFMMLCLMLFNYRKIYKLIRNSEPFGGIAPGTSDFSTGITEYNKDSVIKAVDMASEYRAWKEKGGK